jgi:hypothetical protein
VTSVNIKQVTEAYKFPVSSAKFSYEYGNGGLTLVADSDWEILQSALANVTVDFWYKASETTGLYSIIGQRPSTSTYWEILHTGIGNGFQFLVIVDGVIKINTIAAGILTDFDWHHIKLCKVGNNYGLYKDANQIGYASSNYEYIFNTNLYIGSRNLAGNNVVGYLDEIRIQDSNYFNANPNVLKTDIVSVPTEQYSI